VSVARPAAPAVPALPQAGRARALADFYVTTMRTAISEQFQYRVANYLYMVGMLAEPVIYLVVWTTIARAQGGELNGITVGQFAAYYIVWTLVRNMNLVFTPYGWEWRIRQGELSGQLLRPIHPIHYDLAYFAGWKFVVIVLWLPTAAILALAFRPDLSPTLLEVAVFAVAIWGAYLIRTMFLWLLGMLSFWTTRVSAVFETFMVAELLLSGRLVPMQLMPGAVQRIADFMPFYWTFGFPIEALVADLPREQLLGGLAMQALWTGIGTAFVLVVWRRAVRRYSAVGN
jgi:ABC-2 type transport system permease protein